MRPAGGPGPRHRTGYRLQQRPDLDLPHQAEREVRGRDDGHFVRRQVRGGADLRPRRVPTGAVVLPAAAGRERQDLSRAVQGPVQEPHGPDGGADAEPHHDRVPPGAPVRRLQLRRRDPAVGPRAAERGQRVARRRELPAAPDVDRPVQVPELPAEQAAHARAEHVLEPGHRPQRQAAREQDHRDHEHERQRRRQPAARGRPRRGHGRHGGAGGGEGEDPVFAVAEGAVGRPAQWVLVVRLPEHRRQADEQRALPDGGRVRGQQDEPADGLRWPARGRRDRQHGVAADRRGT